jgi:hypothetical protein
MRERGLQIALMCLGVAVAAYAGCSSDTTGGTTSTSAGGSTSTGTETTTTTTSTGTSTGTGATTTTGGGADNLGLQCLADSDCGSGLKCLAPDAKNPALGGGPANGYCSKDCATDDDCPGLNSLCMGATGSQPGVCLLTCATGPALSSLDEMLDPGKCLGREDVRCTNITNTTTACRPNCGRDDQCPAGTVCDPRSTVCVDKANTGLALGAKCDPKATTPECAGVCASFTDANASWCSSPCVLGGDFATDLTAVADCGGVDKGMCYYRPIDNGAGDLGFCVPACKAQDECQNPSFWCSDVGLPDNGYCTLGTPCPNGQADCKSPDMCTDTKHGPFCLDPKYPLGTAAPAGTSSSSGSGAGGGSSSSSGVGGAGGAGSSASASVGSVSASVSGSSSSTGP